MESEKTFETEVQAYINLIVKLLPLSDMKLQQIKIETEKDNSLGHLKEITVKSWPEYKSDYCTGITGMNFQ